MKDRVKYLKQRIFDIEPSVDINRARLVTRSYKESDCEPIVSIRGKMMHKLFSELPINIGDDELVVGGATAVPRSALLFPEVQAGWLDDELDTISTREFDPLAISREEVQELREEILPYWKGKTIYDRVYNCCPEDTKHLIFLIPMSFPPNRAVS